ncbi:MAG: glycosyltransferase family 39 protein [Patescibacteria group bacterium]
MAKKTVVFILIFSISLLFRFQKIHVPFWVDEFSTANQAALLQKYSWKLFTQKDRYIEARSLSTTSIVAGSFLIFGKSEESARLPIEIIGSLIPFLVFYLSKILVPERKVVRFSATLLSITSYFLITWSRQARGYALQEFLLLLTVIGYFLFFNHSNIRKKIFWLVMSGLSIILGLLTHPSFLIVPMCLFTHLVLVHKEQLLKFPKKRWLTSITAAIIGLVGIFFFKTGLLEQIVTQCLSLVTHGLSNNIWYYHSFLWREYGLVTLLGIIGLLYLVINNFKKGILLTGILVSYLIFVCFLFPAVDSRYILPIFPYLLVGMAISLDLLIQSVFTKVNKKSSEKQLLISVLSGCCTILVILNGHKFDIKPNSFYSVNHDFREIALIDYDQVYSVIKQKGDLASGKTAVIDTWPDRLEWYLGLDFEPNYVLRWEDAGFMKQTPFRLQSNGDKVLVGRSQTKLIATQQDLLKVLSLYPKGFIWIDDTSLPAEVIDYARTHFRQELYLDHYPLDDNPYSVWPGTLYSWGY